MVREWGVEPLRSYTLDPMSKARIFSITAINFKNIGTGDLQKTLFAFTVIVNTICNFSY